MAPGIVLLSASDIPDPGPSWQRDGAFATPGILKDSDHAHRAELRRQARRLGSKKKASARQRKRLRGLKACRATLAILRGEDP